MSISLRYRRPPIRHGLTLVELMVVVGIALLLASVALPMLRPALVNRKIREAARQVNGFFASARTRAEALGRPVGVWMDRDELNPRGSSQLFMAEVPRPYAGDFVGARAQLGDFVPAVAAGGSRDGVAETAIFAAQQCGSLLVSAQNHPFYNVNRALIHRGDLIRFDHKGPHYRIQSIIAQGPAPSFTSVRVTFQHAEWLWHPGGDGGWGTNGVDDDGFNGVDDAGEAGWAGSDDYLLASPIRLRPGLDGNNDGDFFDVPPATSQIDHPVSVSFQIFRRPSRSIVAPLTLPVGVVVDFTNSGIGISADDGTLPLSYTTPGDFNRGREFSIVDARDPTLAPSPQPVIVMFHPQGGIDRFYSAASVAGTRPIGTIHLLIGRSEQLWPFPTATDFASMTFAPPNPLVTPVPALPNQNLTDQANYWVSIGHRTGKITTAENTWPSVDSGTTPRSFLESFFQARQFAQAAQSTGGL